MLTPNEFWIEQVYIFYGTGLGLTKVWGSVSTERHSSFVQTLKDNTIYSVFLCLNEADPATFLASNSVEGPYFPLRTACYGKLMEKN